MQEAEHSNRDLMQEILDHPISGFLSRESSELVTKTVGELIDKDGDIWFYDNRPILSKVAVLKLMKFTRAKVVKTIVHEKQSDAARPEEEQIWMEVFIEFPDGSVHSDDGVANRKNITSDISRKNLPLMARKRGVSRAFLQSPYIGLYEAYDEMEAESFSKEKQEVINLRQLVHQSEEKLLNTKGEYKSLRQMACFYTRLGPDDEKYPSAFVKDVWFVHKDDAYLHNLKQSKDELVAYVADVLLTATIPNQQKQNQEESTEQVPDTNSTAS